MITLGHRPLRSHAASLLVATLGTFSCGGPKEPKCELSGSMPEKLSLSCEGSTRDISCSRATPDEDWMCGCSRGKNLGATFTWPAKEPAIDTADRRELEGFLERKCGWSVSLR